jgi:hypothetical protein
MADGRKVHSRSDPFREVRGFYYREIAALFDLLVDSALGDSVKRSIRKYLIVVIFAALDYFFRNEVRFGGQQQLEHSPFVPQKHSKYTEIGQTLERERYF